MKPRLLVLARNALSLEGLLLLAGVFALVSTESWERAPFMIRLAVGLGAVFYLPGRALLDRLVPAEALERWEKLPLSLAASLALVAPIVVAVMELRLNVLWGAWALLAFCALLLLGRQPPASVPARRPRAQSLAIVTGLAFLGFLLFEIGGLRRTEESPLGVLREEALQLSTVRKLLENETVTRENVMHKPGVTTTYLYPPYHFAFAVASRIAALDPLQVFVKFRPLAGITSLLTLFSILLHVLPRRSWAEVSMLALIAAALSNMGGQIGGSYWAQLIPLSHWSDFGRGLELPILLLLTVKLASGSPALKNLWWLAPFVLAAFLMVHTREVLLLLFYLAAAVAALLLFGYREGGLVKRLSLVAAIAIGVGLLYKARIDAVSGHAVEHESAIRASVQDDLRDLASRPVREVLAEPFDAGQLLYRSAYVLPLVATPLLPLLFRHWFLAFFAPAGLVASLLVLRVPYLTLLTVSATYAEMVFVPARFFYPWAYVLLGLVFVAGILFVDRFVRVGPRSRAGALILGSLLGVLYGWGAMEVLALLRRAALTHFDVFFLFAVLGTLGAFWLPRRKREGAFLEREPPEPRFALVWTVAMLVPLYLVSDQKTLWTLYRETPREARDMSDWDAWYRASVFADVLPPAHLDFLRSQIPPGRLILFPYRHALVVPLLTNHYVAYAALRLSTEVDFGDRWLAVTGKRMSFPEDPYGRLRRRMGFSMYLLEERNPVFAPDEPLEETAALLRELGVEYVLAPAAEVPRLDRLNDLEPGSIETLLARDGLAILRVQLKKSGGARS